MSSNSKNNLSLDSFFKSNLTKTLVFDLCKIKNNGDTLIIDGKESNLVVSYMKMNGEIGGNIASNITRYIYYMINGQVFFISLWRNLNNKVVVCFGDYTSNKNLGWQYPDFKWED